MADEMVKIDPHGGMHYHKLTCQVPNERYITVYLKNVSRRKTFRFGYAYRPCPLCFGKGRRVGIEV